MLFDNLPRAYAGCASDLSARENMANAATIAGTVKDKLIQTVAIVVAI